MGVKARHVRKGRGANERHADEFSKACSAGLVKADETTVNDMK